VKKLFYFILLTIICSCEKAIPFEQEIESNKVVVNGIYFRDSVWKIHLSKSKSILDTSTSTNLENVTISILDQNSNTIDTLQYYNNGFYVGSKSPNYGSYILNIKSILDENITSISTLPNLVPAIIIDTLSYINNGNNRIEISINFDDPINDENYFEIGVYMKKLKMLINTNSNGQTDTNYSLICKWMNLKSDDQNIEKTLDNNLIFNDKLFNGSNKTISIDVRNKIKDFSNDPINELISFDIYFMNISYSLYHFHKSLKDYVNQNSDPFSQPTQVYSNINNGIGVFGGSSPYKINLF
tara:strand:- start:209 stop:1102 length:894 start_codon:yes stop_codon:yes gene_type:complete